MGTARPAESVRCTMSRKIMKTREKIRELISEKRIEKALALATDEDIEYLFEIGTSFLKEDMYDTADKIFGYI